MKALLVSANTLTTPYPVYPLGLDYVAGAIKQKHTPYIVDMNNIRDADDMKSVIDRFLPDVIGLSLRNIDNTDTVDPQGYISEYKKITEIIRTYSNAPLVLGGSGFTLFPAEIMAILNADYGIIGEGERLELLLDALENHIPNLERIEGLIIRGGIPQIPYPWNKPLFREIRIDYPHLEFYLKKGGMLNLQTKRGCPFNCIYCTYPYIEGKKLRYISPESVADTAIMLQEAGAKYLFIADSAFNSDYDHSIAVAKEFKKAGLRVPWGAFFVPTKPPEGYYKIMVAAGMTHAEFGTESLADRILAAYRKPFQVKHVFEAHQQAMAAGANIAHYFLLGGPGETSDTIYETLSNIDKLNKTVLFFFCGMRIYPNTELYDLAVHQGQISAYKSILSPIFYSCESISSREIILQVEAHSKGRLNWIIGAGGEKTSAIISRMYKRGYTGPLWEILIQ